MLQEQVALAHGTFTLQLCPHPKNFGAVVSCLTVTAPAEATASRSKDVSIAFLIMS